MEEAHKYSTPLTENSILSLDKGEQNKLNTALDAYKIRAR
jgi:hypothetical protein